MSLLRLGFFRMADPTANDQPPVAHRSLTEPAAASPVSRSTAAGTAGSPAGRASLAARYPWAVFIVPYVVFVAASMLEPTPQKSLELFGWTLSYASYPVVYTVKIALVIITMLVLWPGYRQFPWRVSPLAVAVGAAGAVVWVGLCKLELERTIFERLGLGDWITVGQRSGFNPMAELAAVPLVAYGFLAVRFLGLAVVVPVIEEFFLRGFVMRYFFQTDWWTVPFGTMSRMAIAAGTLVPILTHPTSELLAVAVWFSLVMWLMWRTRNIWDCVVAHMVTNVLLGVWVVSSGDWHLM
jgi:CAAX prenyl protease-like protein